MVLLHGLVRAWRNPIAEMHPQFQSLCLKGRIWMALFVDITDKRCSYESIKEMIVAANWKAEERHKKDC